MQINKCKVARKYNQAKPISFLNSQKKALQKKNKTKQKNKKNHPVSLHGENPAKLGIEGLCLNK